MLLPAILKLPETCAGNQRIFNFRGVEPDGDADSEHESLSTTPLREEAPVAFHVDIRLAEKKHPFGPEQLQPEDYDS